MISLSEIYMQKCRNVNTASVAIGNTDT